MLKYETDSRKVQPGQTFVAIKGNTVDGHDFIEQAIKNGAKEVVVDHEVTSSVPVRKVTNTKEYLKEHLVREYQEKLSALRLIGITGTNGKTTTCYLTYQLLKKLGVKVAYMGTIGFFYEEEKIELPNTTPDILKIYNLFLDALEKGCTAIVMEVSSHAIAQERILGLSFEIGGFTNLTEDHLDFHKTMENYLETKLGLFHYMKPDGKFLVNFDDPYGVRFLEKFSNARTISLKKSDYQILSYDFTPSSTKINLFYQKETYSFSSHLTGKFNVYNVVFALAIAVEYGFSIKEILKKIEEVYPPKGRCQTFQVGSFFAVVDYAHTPDAVEKVIDCYHELAQERIITVVGCGGDRDPMKRPIMGNIATSKSDYVIFTNDNPRTEEENKIMDDIIKGVQKDNYEIIFDRKKAIEKALSIAKENDIVLVLGKGHEDYQIIGHEKVHFDDAEEIQKFIQTRNLV